MDALESQVDLPAEWRAAIAEAAAQRRVLVLGATDVGKTSFIRGFFGLAGQVWRLIDVDPGQKMIGPPGTAGVGGLDRLDRMIFLGTTSASALSAIAAAARQLTSGAEPFIVNTSGLVRGIGARLQAMTVAAVKPDLIVQIGDEPVLPESGAVPTVRIGRSALAQRKSPGLRSALRQAAFDREFEDASQIALTDCRIEPGPLLPWESAARPVCALADGRGRDLALGIIEAAEEEGLIVRTRAAPARVKQVRIGRMWAEAKDGRWRLLDRLSPDWRSP